MKPKKRLATLVLDPDTWLRGEGSIPSALLRPYDGKMCCLGFECLRRGADKRAIESVKIPSGVRHHKIKRRVFEAKEAPGLRREMAIAQINDDTGIPVTRAGDLKRVRKLRPYFEKLGVRLVLGRSK